MKKDLTGFIIEVEGLSRSLGENIADILEKVYQETKNKDFLEIAKKYKKYQKKSKAYEGYIDKDILKMIKALEEQNQDVSEILEEFNEIYQKTKLLEKDVNKTINSSIFFMIAIYVVGLVMLSKFANMGEKIIRSLNVPVDNLTMTIYSFFKIFGIVFIALYIIAFIVLKRKNPLTKKIYDYLDSIKMLLILKIGLRSGIPASDIAKIMKDSIGIKVKSKLVDMESLIKLTSKYLEDLERASLKMGLEGGISKAEEVINTLLFKKVKEMESKVETYKGALSYVFKIGQMLLLLFVIAGYLSFMVISIKINQAMSKGGM